jgi:endoglucanase
MENFNTKFSIKRGLNVSHWLSQSEMRGSDREDYITEKDFKLIADLGFDHVRLPIDEEQMWNGNGEKEQEAFNLMHRAIKWSFDNNLRVIIDLHVLRSHHFNRPDSIKLWEDKSAQEGFIKFWKVLSTELKKYPNNMLAYEPLNEAVSDNPDDWNNLINWVIAEIRKLETERTIIMGSNNWQQVGTFKELKVPANDDNIILSFHYYEPFLLTHYQAGWTDFKDINVEINYPGQIVDTALYKSLDTLQLNIIKDRNGFNDINTIKNDIYQAVKIAEKYGLKLYCGEFGAYPTTDLNLRISWYRDMISIFDEYEIAWAHWNYKNDFPVVSENLEPIYRILNVLIPQN